MIGRIFRFPARAIAHGEPSATRNVTATCAWPIARLHAIGAASHPLTIQVHRLRSPRRTRVADEQHDEEGLPDQRRGLVRQEGQGPEGDGQERWVAIEARVVRGRGLDVEREAGVQSRAGVVVGAHVRERVEPEVKDQRIDADDQAQDARGDEHPAHASRREESRDVDGHRMHPIRRLTCPDILARVDLRRAIRENGVAVVLMAILVLVVADDIRELLAGYPIGVDVEIPLRAAERWLAGGDPYPASAFLTRTGDRRSAVPLSAVRLAAHRTADPPAADRRVRSSGRSC